MLKQIKGKKRNMDSGSNSKKLILSLFSGLFLLHIHHVQAQDPYLIDCSNSTNYISNTQFETNLNLLFRFLVSNGARNGFLNDTIGTSPDTVYGLVQCRGDISMQDCQTCLNTSTIEILQRCPNQKSAALRYDFCILRYSNSQFTGQYDGNFRALLTTANVGDTETGGFNQRLGVLMNNLTTTAASRESRDYWGSVNYYLSSTKKIYGMVQCTTDLSPANCFACLQNGLAYISSSNCCLRSPGVRMFSTTCYIRYEIYSFLANEPQQVDTHRRAEEGEGKSTKVVTMVALVVGGSVLFLAICLFTIIRRTRNI